MSFFRGVFFVRIRDFVVYKENGGLFPDQIHVCHILILISISQWTERIYIFYWHWRKKNFFWKSWNLFGMSCPCFVYKWRVPGHVSDIDNHWHLIGNESLGSRDQNVMGLRWHFISHWIQEYGYQPYSLYGKEGYFYPLVGNCLPRKAKIRILDLKIGLFH